MSTATGVPRAATFVLARPSASGFDVLLLQRTRAASFMPSAWVFPGGRVDEADRAGVVADRLMAGPAARAAECDVDLETVRVALAAGVRETREEAGIDLEAVLGPADPVHLLARWVTPSAEARRFDTLVFFARVAPATVAREDHLETVQHRWLTPAAAVAESSSGRLLLMPPTLRTLEELALVPTTEALPAWMGARAAAVVIPKLDRAASPPTILLPWHPRYGATPGEGTATGAPPRGWLSSAAFVLSEDRWSSVWARS